MPAFDTDGPSIRSSIIATVESNPSAYSRWTEEQNDELLRLIRNREERPDIAAAVGRTRSAVRTQGQCLAFMEVYGRALPAASDYPRNGGPWTPDDLTLLDSLVRTSSSWTILARQ